MVCRRLLRGGTDYRDASKRRPDHGVARIRAVGLWWPMFLIEERHDVDWSPTSRGKSYTVARLTRTLRSVALTRAPFQLSTFSKANRALTRSKSASRPG